MRFLNTIALFLLLTGLISAQNADEYFHNGAQSFISADMQAATQYVDEGLAQYPNDPKLNALKEQLEKEKQKQQQQQQNQDQQQQNQNQDQQDQQQNQNQQQQDQQQQQQNQNQGENNSEQNPQEQQQGAQPQQISKEDAQKILQALAQKEKELLKNFKKQKTQGSAKHEKDW